MNDTVDTVDAANAVNTVENNTAKEGDTSVASGGVQGIWKATLGKKEIIMAVNQSAQSVFGLAKFEGDNPWNGALAGHLSSVAISLSLAANEGETVASTYISATLDGDSMNGFYIRSDSNGKASRGDFTATMISPDTSGYTPAVITSAPLPEPLPAVQTEQVSTAPKNEAPSSEVSKEPVTTQETASRFKDVTQLAKGINPNIMPRMAPL